MLYYATDSIEYETAEALYPRSKQLIREFKLYQLAEAERSLTRSKNLAQTSFGALLKLRAKQELLDSLYSSCATLLVVPNTLAQHWEVGGNCISWDAFDDLLFTYYVAYFIYWGLRYLIFRYFILYPTFRFLLFL